MSILTIAYPVQAALPAVSSFFGSAAGLARPLFGLGALATLMMTFKPLLTGVLRALGMVLLPRANLDQRNGRRKLAGVMMLNSMARDLDQSQPSQAAELRMLATRD